MPERIDEQLIADYLGGNENSLEVLIKRYLKPVHSFVYKNVGDTQATEDITQDVFVKMWRNMRRFRAGKGSFKTWLFTIAKNASIDFLKKKKSIPFSHFSVQGGSAYGGENALIETLASPAPLASEIFAQASIKEMLLEAIKQLSPQYRKVLLLRYNNQFTFREIANALGEPLNTIKSRYRRALFTLKKLLVN